MASVTVTAKSEPGRSRSATDRLPLTGSRLGRLILFMNIFGLVVLIGGALVLNELRRGLIEARLDSLKTHNLEDLYTNLEMIGAIERMLKYYMVASDAEAFIEDVRQQYWPESLRHRFSEFAVEGLVNDLAEEATTWDDWFEPEKRQDDRLKELEERIAELEAEREEADDSALKVDNYGRRYLYNRDKKMRMYVDPED